MASAGFLGGLGQGLQGMSQSLAQYLALKQQDKDRALQQKRYQDDLAFRQSEQAYRKEHDVTEDAYRARQEARQTHQDDRGLIEKVLGNITGNTRVTPEFAQKAKTEGFEPFIQDAPPTTLINPITHMPMGGVPGGIMAKPMMPPAVQAQIDALRERSAAAEERLGQGQERLELTNRYNNGLLDAKSNALAMQENALMLRRQMADQATDLRQAIAQSANARKVAQDVATAAQAKFPLAAFDEVQAKAARDWSEAEYNARMANVHTEGQRNQGMLNLPPMAPAVSHRQKMPTP